MKARFVDEVREGHPQLSFAVSSVGACGRRISAERPAEVFAAFLDDEKLAEQGRYGFGLRPDGPMALGHAAAERTGDGVWCGVVRGCDALKFASGFGGRRQWANVSSHCAGGRGASSHPSGPAGPAATKTASGLTGLHEQPCQTAGRSFPITLRFRLFFAL